MNTNASLCAYGLHEMTCDNSKVRTDRNGRIECRACSIEGARRFRRAKPLYDIWRGIIRRCSDPTFKDWLIYGGKTRPVTVCSRWLESFDAFVEDMGKRPSVAHSIDRIDGSKGYEPENCRWATATEQARNMRTNRYIEFNGDTRTLAEWAELSGLKYMTLFQRLNRGMPLDIALTRSPTSGARRDLNRTRNAAGQYE